MVVRTPDPSRLASVLSEAGPHVEVATRADGALLVTGLSSAEAGHRAFTAGCELHELSTEADALERVFLELTGGES